MKLDSAIKEIIKNKHRVRANCPVCGHKNTLSVSQTGTEIVYYCFSASCGIKGRIKDDVTLDILRTVNSGINLYSGDIYLKQNFSFYTPNNRCRTYLNSFNIYVSNLDDLGLLYDPKQNRLVFPLNYKGENYGYTGRALDIRTLPKWYVYVRHMGCPFIGQNRNYLNSSVVLVEDCISVIRGMEYFNTIGLLGTSVSSQTVGYLLEYDTIYIALDPDALAKSVKLQKQLSSYRPTKILSIDKDIKYMTNLELEKIKEELNVCY